MSSRLAWTGREPRHHGQRRDKPRRRGGRGGHCARGRRVVRFGVDQHARPRHPFRDGRSRRAARVLLGERKRHAHLAREGACRRHSALGGLLVRPARRLLAAEHDSRIGRRVLPLASRRRLHLLVAHLDRREGMGRPRQRRASRGAAIRSDGPLDQRSRHRPRRRARLVLGRRPHRIPHERRSVHRERKHDRRRRHHGVERLRGDAFGPLDRLLRLSGRACDPRRPGRIGRFHARRRQHAPNGNGRVQRRARRALGPRRGVGDNWRRGSPDGDCRYSRGRRRRWHWRRLWRGCRLDRNSWRNRHCTNLLQRLRNRRRNVGKRRENHDFRRHRLRPRTAVGHWWRLRSQRRQHRDFRRHGLCARESR